MKRALWIIFIALLIAVQFVMLFYVYNDANDVKRYLELLSGFGQNQSVSYQIVVNISNNVMYWACWPIACVLYAGFIVFLKPKKLFLHQSVCMILTFTGACLLVILPYWAIIKIGTVV